MGGREGRGREGGRVGGMKGWREREGGGARGRQGGGRRGERKSEPERSIWNCWASPWRDVIERRVT